MAVVVMVLEVVVMRFADLRVGVEMVDGRRAVDGRSGDAIELGVDGADIVAGLIQGGNVGILAVILVLMVDRRAVGARHFPPQFDAPSGRRRFVDERRILVTSVVVVVGRRGRRRQVARPATGRCLQSGPRRRRHRSVAVRRTDAGVALGQRFQSVELGVGVDDALLALADHVADR